MKLQAKICIIIFEYFETLHVLIIGPSNLSSNIPEKINTIIDANWSKKPFIENNIIQQKEHSTNIVETTTYSTTNSSTDYDIHIDTGDFIRMMNTSLTELKQTGDKKKFVTGFFDYMFKHVTDIRHFEETKNE